MNLHLNNIYKVILVIILFVTTSTYILGQKSNSNFSIHSDFIQDDDVEVKLHHYKSLKSDYENEKGAGLKFAHQFTVNYTPENSGNWYTLDDGTKIWKLRISSPGAYSINLIFDRYVLPKGAKLLIYNISQTEVIGAFTSENNKSSGILATAPVEGDEIVVEYQEPANPEFKGELLIGAVNHDYLGISKYTNLKTGDFGDSDYCEQDITCYDQDNTLDIRRAALRLLVNGTLFCSGTLINNVNEDGTPYVITAAHCLDSNTHPGTSDAIIAYLNYEVPHCSSVIEGVKYQTISGGETKVYQESADLALVLMQEEPPAYYRPYFAGWTLNSLPSEPFTCIHHPQGDVKKVSTSTTAIQSVSYVVSGNDPYTQEANFHWKVDTWNLGTTEGGSSGSALFDTNNKIIGTLSGGEASCGWLHNDYYTRFYKGWDYFSEDTCHFSTWLDPLNTGAQSLDGYDPYSEDLYDRISNIEAGELPDADNSGGNGYISGHNSYGITKYAEKFTGIKTANLNGVYIMPGVSNSSSSQTIDLYVWEGSSYPENILLKQDAISLSDLKVNQETYIAFSEPVSVSGTFFVGYEIDYSGSPIDSFAVYHTQDGSVSKVNNSMMVEYNSSWELATNVYGGEMKTLWIDVLADMVVLGDTQISIASTNEIKIYPNPLVNTSIAQLDTKGLFIESYSIIDMNGRVLDKKQFTNSSLVPIDIDMSDIPDGLYIIDLNLDSEHLYKKIVKASQ